jgi:hypothetical protein
VISRAVNSISAQETGSDYGDYYLLTGGGTGFSLATGGRSALRFDIDVTRVDSVTAAGRWARGSFSRPNPGVDRGYWTTARLAWRRRTSSFAARSDLSGRLELELGAGDTVYARCFAEVRWQVPAGAASLLVRAAGGAAAGAVPRHRGFVLGGRGTLLGEPFRGSGGSRMGWLALEWRQSVPFPEVRLGSFAGTGSRVQLIPNAAIGWTGGRIAGFMAAPGAGPDASLGIGVSWPHSLLRLDVGYGVRSRRLGFSIDVDRSFWDIL